MSKPFDLRGDKELLGQLIAELAKFGGMGKTKASQLARILLPHITSDKQRLLKELMEQAVDDGEVFLLVPGQPGRFKRKVYVPVEVIQNKLEALSNRSGDG